MGIIMCDSHREVTAFPKESTLHQEELDSMKGSAQTTRQNPAESDLHTHVKIELKLHETDARTGIESGGRAKDSGAEEVSARHVAIHAACSESPPLPLIPQFGAVTAGSPIVAESQSLRTQDRRPTHPRANG